MCMFASQLAACKLLVFLEHPLSLGLAYPTVPQLHCLIYGVPFITGKSFNGLECLFFFSQKYISFVFYTWILDNPYNYNKEYQYIETGTDTDKFTYHINDFVLLVLDRSLTSDEHVKIASLPASGYIPSSECYASGWGSLTASKS